MAANAPACPARKRAYAEQIENANSDSARSEAVNPTVLLIVFSFRDLSLRSRETAIAHKSVGLIDSRRQATNLSCSPPTPDDNELRVIPDSSKDALGVIAVYLNGVWPPLIDLAKWSEEFS